MAVDNLADAAKTMKIDKEEKREKKCESHEKVGTEKDNGQIKQCPVKSSAKICWYLQIITMHLVKCMKV